MKIECIFELISHYDHFYDHCENDKEKFYNITNLNLWIMKIRLCLLIFNKEYDLNNHIM